MRDTGADAGGRGGDGGGGEGVSDAASVAMVGGGAPRTGAGATIGSCMDNGVGGPALGGGTPGGFMLGKCSVIGGFEGIKGLGLSSMVS